MKDLIILGAGPAGLGASVYASRYQIKHVILGEEVGGYLNEIHKIENYLGFEAISGMELGMKMKAHVESLGGTLKQETALKIEKIEGGFKVTTNKEEYQARSLLYAIGTSARKLNVEGEKEFLGKGVSYCATCDGPFFRNKKVVVVGGGNSAAMAALMLAEQSNNVTLVHRGKELSCSPNYFDRMKNSEWITIEYNKNIARVEGANVVERIILKDEKDEEIVVEANGIFVEIGSIPNQQMLVDLGVEINKNGFIVTDQAQLTSIEGIYAAGDITTNSNGFRQIITAAAEGAVAALEIFKRLK